jgi:hypothetical protein
MAEGMAYRAKRGDVYEISDLSLYTLCAMRYALCALAPATRNQRPASKDRHTADKLNASRPTVKADGYRFSLDNDRNFAGPFRVFQHGVQMPGLFNHVIIFDLAAFFGKRFTSCPGVRSSILSKKQNFIRHIFLPV